MSVPVGYRRPGPKKRKVIRRSLADHPSPTPLDTPCRLWQGTTTSAGYGRMTDFTTDPRRTVQAHRWVVAQVEGWDAVDGKHVMHLCDQPLCFRYDHLRVGSHIDNMVDMAAKDRWNNQYRSGMAVLATHCKYGHEFTEENTYIRKDTGARMCRACHRETQKRLARQKRSTS